MADDSGDMSGLRVDKFCGLEYKFDKLPEFASSWHSHIHPDSGKGGVLALLVADIEIICGGRWQEVMLCMLLLMNVKEYKKL